MSSSFYRFLCLTVCVGLIARPGQAAGLDRNAPKAGSAPGVVLGAEVDGVISVSAGLDFTCGVKKLDNSVACWGLNDDGQSSPPSGAFTQVSAGAFHTCGVKQDNSVACWGDDFEGQSSPPMGTFTQVSAGAGHTCGVKLNYTVACWGLDDDGQSSPPSGVFTQVSAGSEHTCGVRLDETVACWGNPLLPEVNPPDETFTQVSAGFDHTCGVKLDETLACWGGDSYGQSAPPADTFTQVSAGYFYSCGVKKQNGTVACWGNNSAGRATPPTGVFTQVSAGYFHTCGVRQDGTVTCWGYNDLGQAPSASLSPLSLEAAWLGHAYNQPLSASGTTVPYQFSREGEGELPPGLNLALDGIISGTPTSLGVYTFTVQARDSSSPQFSGQKEYTINVVEITQLFLPLVSR